MSKKNLEPKDPTEVVLQYKNDHYTDNFSSIHTPLSFESLQSNFQDHTNVCKQPRPISCPVCTKMIAMNSILVHFYFEHPKVLKLRLTNSKRRHIVVKAADLSYETKCLAVFLLEEGKSSTGDIKPDSIYTNKIRPFLLLATKMNIGLSSKFNLNNNNCVEKKCTEEKLNRNLRHHRFDKNDILLFWTCKTDNLELISNVKLSRNDKKISFSYTGEAIYIGEKQDAMNVYRHTECLILRGEAANNLLDSDDQMHVFVRCL